MINYSNYDSHIMEGERIAQLIIEEIDMSDAMEVDKLDNTIQEDKRFRSSDFSLKQWVRAMDTLPVLCILRASHVEGGFFGHGEVNNHSRLLREPVTVSSMTI